MKLREPCCDRTAHILQRDEHCARRLWPHIGSSGGSGPEVRQTDVTAFEHGGFIFDPES